MRRDIEVLLTCDAVLCLEGWEASPGASTEVAVAWSLGLPIWQLVVTDDGTKRLDPVPVTRVLIPREYETSMLVGVMGYARSGKDTVAQHLLELGWSRVAFADPMKEMLYALNPGVTCSTTVSNMVDRMGWEKAKEHPRIRQFLQRIGTEAGRNVLGQEIWVQLAEGVIESTPTPVVVTDCRFRNEVQMIRRRGGTLLWISRPGVLPANNHASENSVGPDDADIVIENDGSIQDLWRKVDDVLERKFDPGAIQVG